MNSILILTATGMAALFFGVFNLRKLLLPLVCAGLLLALGLALAEWQTADEARGLVANFLRQIHIDSPNSAVILKYMSGMMAFDNYSIAFIAVMIMSCIFIMFLADEFFRTDDMIGPANVGDMYALILFTLIGGIMMVSYQHMSMLFIGIETLSISLYILAGSRKMDLSSNEASLKYFLMGSFSTGFLLLGIALMYGASGSFELKGLQAYVQNLNATGTALPLLFKTGVVLVLIGLFFKVSAAPFHFWAPDVYQGSPTLISGFMASVVKTAGFAALLKLLMVPFGTLVEYKILLWAIALLTVLIGNFSAVYQSSVKRMLAYSSVANAGYLLVALSTTSEVTPSVVLYYALSYSLATIVAFAVLIVVMRERGSEDYEAFRGLAQRHPVLAGIMVIAMLSLAGIPPLGGFFGKYYIFASLLNPNMVASDPLRHWSVDPMNLWLIGVSLLGSLIGVYYYFRVIVAVFTPDADAEKSYVRYVYQGVLVLAVVLILLLGMYPNQLINPINDSLAYLLP